MTLSFCYSVKYLRKDHQQNFSLLINFTCTVAKDELEKHPEMRTIAMVELENNFPSDFSRKVLKCLPEDVAKIILNPHAHLDDNSTLILPKQTMAVYVADAAFMDKGFVESYFKRNYPVLHHLSKYLIVSSKLTRIEEPVWIFRNRLNVVQIFEENRKVIARYFDRTKNLTTFESSQQILFPDKTKNLNGKQIHVVWNDDGVFAYWESESNRLNCKWTYYLDIIAEKLNATLNFNEIKPSRKSSRAYAETRTILMEKLLNDHKLEFFLGYPSGRFDLESYNYIDWCFIAPLPKPFSITELILFLPMDKSCWMWLGITIAVSTLIWKISEGHWNFAFGAFSYFMGQAQLSVRIQTNRLTMKILLQLLIFGIFIFSNGYQSIVTSFMLNPVEIKLLKTVEDVFDSDLKIAQSQPIKEAKITTTSILDQIYGNNPKYLKAQQNGRFFYNARVVEDWADFLIKMNMARVQPCKFYKEMIEHQGDGKSLDGIYLVPEAAYTKSIDLYVRPLHPHIDRFQELMDRSFENGLHQAWERFFWENGREGVTRKELEEENDILDFSLIAPFFIILAVGFLIALIALLCEIFWKDFVSELSRDYFERKKDEIFGIQRSKPNVRVIQVKPKMRRTSA